MRCSWSLTWSLTLCGLYSYERLSNDLNTAPALEKIMDQILQGLEDVLCYLDNVLIVSRTQQDNLVMVLTGVCQPVNISELMFCIWLLRYYQKFLLDLGIVLEPLNALMRQGNPWIRVRFKRLPSLNPNRLSWTQEYLFIMMSIFLSHCIVMHRPMLSAEFCLTLLMTSSVPRHLLPVHCLLVNAINLNWNKKHWYWSMAWNLSISTYIYMVVTLR